jgi:hypothetical protein
MLLAGWLPYKIPVWKAQGVILGKPKGSIVDSKRLPTVFLVNLFARFPKQRHNEISCPRQKKQSSAHVLILTTSNENRS